MMQVAVNDAIGRDVSAARCTPGSGVRPTDKEGRKAEAVGSGYFMQMGSLHFHRNEGRHDGLNLSRMASEAVR